ncbi:MAG: hypothetical protein U0Q16_31350 [Bryobacteraceae bacterium]
MYRGILIDSTGRASRIAAAEIERPKGLWARLRQSRQHSVKVQLFFNDAPQVIPLDEAKALLTESLAKRSPMARRFQGLEREQVLREQVSAAATYEQAFRLLHEFDRIPRELL